MTVITVYGVLFLDWNNSAQGKTEHQPFEGVCCCSLGLKYDVLTCGRFDRGSSA